MSQGLKQAYQEFLMDSKPLLAEELAHRVG